MYVVFVLIGGLTPEPTRAGMSNGHGRAESGFSLTIRVSEDHMPPPQSSAQPFPLRSTHFERSFPCPISYPDLVVRPVLLQILVNLPIVLTHVFRIPPITSDNAIRERSMLSLECRVSAAHDALSEVLKAVRQVSLHLFVNDLPRGQARVDFEDVVKAVQLVGDRGREDGVFIAFDWVREIVVFRGIVYFEVAETLLGGLVSTAVGGEGTDVGACILGTMLSHFFLTASENKSEPFSGTKAMSGTNDMICWETGGMKPVISPLPSSCPWRS